MSKLNTSKRRKSVRSFGKSSHSTRFLLASAVGSALLATRQANAQLAGTLYWGGTNTPAGSNTPFDTGAWDGTAQNWTDNSAGDGTGNFTAITQTTNSLVFNAGTIPGDYTVTVSGTQAAGNITFAAAGNVTLTGGTISLAAGSTISNSTGDLATFGTSINNTNGSSFNVIGNSSTTFNTVTNVLGGGSITVNVTTTGGVTTFGGTGDNSSAQIIVNSGIVSADKASNSGTHIEGNGLTILTGGTVQINGNPTTGTIDQQFYQGSNVQISGGTLDLNGRNEGMPQLNGTSTGTITNTAGTLATLSLGENNSGGTYNGQIINGTGGIAVTEIGTGTGTLTGNNTFTGGLTINSGAIQFAQFNSLGNGNITIGNSTNTGVSATLNANANSTGGFTGNITNPIFSTGNGTNEITATGWNPTFTGAIVLNNDLILNVNNGGSSTLIARGGVTGTGNLSLQVTDTNGGSSVQLLGAAVNNTGNITVSNNGTGTGSVTISANIGSNVNTVTENAPNFRLFLNGTNTFGALTILAGNTTVLNNGNLPVGTGNITIGNSANTGILAEFSTNQNVTFANSIFSTGSGTSEILDIDNGPTFSGPITLSGSGTGNNLLLAAFSPQQGNWGHPLFNAPITGTGSLTLQSLGVDSRALVVVSGNVTITGPIVNNGSGNGTNVISGNITTPANIIQSSATSGLSLTADGPSGNSFGNLTITAGSVLFQYFNDLGNGTVTLGGASGASAVLNANGGGSHQADGFLPNGLTGSSNIVNPISAVGSGIHELAVTNWNPTFTGPITLTNSNFLIASNNTAGSTSTISGGITGNGNLTIQSNAINATANSPTTLSGNPINNAGSITNNGVATGGHVFSTTISAVIGSNVTGVTENSLNSPLILSNNDLYTGPTAVNTGTLQITGTLNGTAGTPLTFGGTGTANFNEASGSTQGMGGLTLSAGDATIQSTGSGSGATLTFANVTPRSVGATGNFVETGASPNIIALTQFNSATTPTGTLLDPGIFFNGANYAAYDAGAFVRAYNYSSDTNGAISSGGTTLESTTAPNTAGPGINVQLTGAITAQDTLTINTLNILNNSNLAFVDGNQTLTASGILLSGNISGGATISSGLGIQAPNNGELVIRTDAINDALTLSTPIIANGVNALTKSGTGSLTLAAAANTYTGPTFVNAGTLNLTTSGTNNISASPSITVASTATLNTTGVSGTGGFTLASNQVLGGSGTVVGNLTVATGSKISAGTSIALGTGNANSNAKLTTAGETWNTGGTYSWKITNAGGAGAPKSVLNTGTTPGVDWDDLQMTSLSVVGSGTFTIAPVGAVTNVNFGAPGVGGSYDWVIAQTSSAPTGPSGNITTGSNLLTASPALFTLNTSGFTVDGVAPTASLFSLQFINVGGTNNDLVLSYNTTPEPGTAILLLAGFVPMLTSRRRRRNSEEMSPV
jgi:fibronectin-binding autotransporter adhesin